MCDKKLRQLYIFGSIFILFLFVHRGMVCFAFMCYITALGKFCYVTFFKQLLFCFILLPLVHLLVPKKNKTCNIKQKVFIYIFLLKFLFSLLSIFLSYLSLLLNSNKASETIFETIFDVRKEHIALHMTIFVQQ